MKKLSILSMLLLFISMGNIQAQTVKEESRKQKKAEQELLDQMFFDEAKQAIEMKNFILEADHIMFKYGTTAFVSPNTNFVAVKGNKAVVQVAFIFRQRSQRSRRHYDQREYIPDISRLPTKR